MLNWTSLNLWPHQKEALNDLVGYLKASVNSSFLVHMPTGSGKTGIIATLARFIMRDNPKVLLILAPRVSLRDQLFAEVNGNFFSDKLGLGNDPELKRLLSKSDVINFNDSYSGSLQLNGKRLIVISTIQKINIAHNSDKEKKEDDDAKVFTFLRNHTDLVIIDEGHYEPAISWSSTIRSLGNKRILFTATPYRNDFKHFDFSEDFVFSFSYNHALKGKFLRHVEFIHPKVGTTIPGPDDLIEEIEKVRSTQLTGDTNAKIIIRCDNADRIVEIANAILRKYKNEKFLVAFHENRG